MARYVVISKGELRKAGQFLKQVLTLSKPDGGNVEAFTWVSNEEDAANIHVGDVLEGELTFKDSGNPKYPGEWKLGKWTKVEGGAAAVKDVAPSAPSTKGISTDSKDERIARGNACNAVSSLHAGKAIEPGDFYAEVRQMYFYITTGIIPEMSTKEQHEAILAMFTKEIDGKRVPDIEAAHDELFKSTGIPYIRALTKEEAASFLQFLTPD